MLQQQQQQPSQPAQPVIAQPPQEAIAELARDHKHASVDEVALERDMYPKTAVPASSTPPSPPPKDDVEPARSTDGPVDGLQINHDPNARPQDGRVVDSKRVPGLAVNEPTQSKPKKQEPEMRTEAQQHPAEDLRHSQDAVGNYPNPDLVLVFSLPKPDASREEWQAAEQEYNKLKKALQQAGLLSIARPGAKGRNERLILVRAVQSVVRAEAQREK